MITLAFRFLLLIISLCGFFLYFSSKMKAELCIGFVFSAIGYTMFIAGILNILPETALCIFIAGFACLAVSFRKKNPNQKYHKLRNGVFCHIGGRSFHSAIQCEIYAL